MAPEKTLKLLFRDTITKMSIARNTRYQLIDDASGTDKFAIDSGNGKFVLFGKNVLKNSLMMVLPSSAELP